MIRLRPLCEAVCSRKVYGGGGLRAVRREVGSRMWRPLGVVRNVSTGKLDIT